MGQGESGRGRGAAAALLAAVCALGCVTCGHESDPLAFSVTVEVTDDAGALVSGARVDPGGGAGAATTGTGGRATLDLDQPVLALVSKDDVLDEPVAIGRGDAGQVVRVRVWRSMNGHRWAMHSAGDVMFGRRFTDPPEGDPLIPHVGTADAARAVVESVRRAYAAADVRSLNLETVVSDLPAGDAYPGKRFILESWPETLAGVQALDANVVVQANNHTRDFLDQGLSQSHQALAAAHLSFVGSSDGTGPAEVPLVVRAGGIHIGVLAWTTVEGSYVNDSYPDDGVPMPSGVDPADAWQYQTRTWGFTGATWSAPPLPRRIGSAWALYSDAEPSLPAGDAAAAWDSLVAVYPELQDWVARRGHGGAAHWVTSEATAAIQDLAARTDLVVVQLHAGYQFQSAPSDYVRSIAQHAIDAGADIVICHHPHVLQGAEWYRGHLIVYSLGNFVFDQDFLSTFASAFLRTVWDGNTLLEARFVPVEVAGYKPAPVADAAATRTLRAIAEMSAARAAAARGDDGAIRVFPADLGPDTVPAGIRLEHHSAVLLRGVPKTHAVSLDVGPGEVAALPADALVDPRLGLAAGDPGAVDLEIGRDLLGWGSFEDQVADGEQAADTHWDIDGVHKWVVQGDGGAAGGSGYLRLERRSDNESIVLARPVARIPMPAHRLYSQASSQAPEGLDPPAHYGVHVRVRRTGDGPASVRLDFYHFDDTNPTEDPSSSSVGQYLAPIPAPADGAWHTVDIDVPAGELDQDGVTANMVMVYVRLEVPSEDKVSDLDVDDLSFVEWRSAAGMTDRLGAYDLVRNRGSAAAALSIPVSPLR